MLRRLARHHSAPVYDKVVARVVEGARKLAIGAPEAPETHTGPVIDANAFKKIREYIEIGRR